MERFIEKQQSDLEILKELNKKKQIIEQMWYEYQKEKNEILDKMAENAYQDALLSEFL